MSDHVLPFAVSAHAEAQRLLPWLVNGTLDADERDWLQHHLDACSDCMRELQAQRSVQAACIEVEGPAGAMEIGWRRLQRRLATPRSPVPASWREVWRTRWQAMPRRWAWAFAAQTALLLALAAVVWWPRAEPTAYHTLGVPAARTGNLVIVFDPQISETQLRRLLTASDARIVDGPNEAGAYVLAVPPARADSVRDALRAAPGVTMVESLKAGAAR